MTATEDTPPKAEPAPFFRHYNVGTNAEKYETQVDYPPRPGFNTTGKEIGIYINAYQVMQFPNKSIHQYDVVIGNGAEKRIVNSKVWNSKTRLAKLGNGLLYDGNALAWSLREVPASTFDVDLDEEQGRRPGKTPNKFRLAFRKTKAINLECVGAYLRGQSTFTSDVLQCLSFFDHLLRETPSKDSSLISLKRSFFSHNGEKANIGAGVEAYRGVYQSIRMAQGGKMIVNLDVSNSCFWQTSSLVALANQAFGVRDTQQLALMLKPKILDDGHRIPSKAFQGLTRFKNIVVRAKYRQCPCPEKEWSIKAFTLLNAKEYKQDFKDKATGKVENKSVFDYFRQKYGITLEFWHLPLVEMKKKGVFYPFEVLHVYGANKYTTKLDEDQTAKMIKFAVSPPPKRMQAINDGKALMKWDKDPILAQYGLKIDQNMMKVKARLLPSPKVTFGGSNIDPGVTGRWDLRNKKFFAPNSKPLKSWGVGMFMRGREPLDKAQVEAFVQGFVKAYKAHGGDLNPTPHIMPLPDDAGKAVQELWTNTGNHFRQRPDILVFILQNKEAFHYLRIKKSAECRFGVMTQCMQAAHVKKCNPQYFSNVLMKFNAKLGGTTSQATSKGAFKGFGGPTMLIGADVSHASPGSEQPSMAAMTVSLDKFGGRYGAACQTNGKRVEMIAEANIRSMLGPLIQRWRETLGGGALPKQIYYFRDGVAEGQYQHVIQQEIPHLKKLLSKMDNPRGDPWQGKIAVIICSKRHHIRAFPTPNDRDAADKNANPLPGVLIETGCTSPRGWDFYLYSHIALQGTSRPVHYTVIQDEIGLNVNSFPNMVYEHCYQYMRSTTSVGLFPAVYYAHLASNRAKAHENVGAEQGPQGGPGYKQNTPKSSDPQPVETPPLLPLLDDPKTPARVPFGMWYI